MEEWFPDPPQSNFVTPLSDEALQICHLDRSFTIDSPGTAKADCTHSSSKTALGKISRAALEIHILYHDFSRCIAICRHFKLESSTSIIAGLKLADFEFRFSSILEELMLICSTPRRSKFSSGWHLAIRECHLVRISSVSFWQVEESECRKAAPVCSGNRASTAASPLFENTAPVPPFDFHFNFNIL